MQSTVRTTLAVLLALAGLQATAEAQAKPKQLGDRNRVNVEELRAAPATTVYEFVRARRAHWLSTRGQATLATRAMTDFTTGERAVVGVAPEVAVYVDGTKHGSQDVLRSMSTDDVDSMEYLDSSSATQRFGTGHAHGAIVIRRRVR